MSENLMTVPVKLRACLMDCCLQTHQKDCVNPHLSHRSFTFDRGSDAHFDADRIEAILIMVFERNRHEAVSTTVRFGLTGIAS